MRSMRICICTHSPACHQSEVPSSQQGRACAALQVLGPGSVPGPTHLHACAGAALLTARHCRLVACRHVYVALSRLFGCPSQGPSQMGLDGARRSETGRDGTRRGEAWRNGARRGASRGSRGTSQAHPGLARLRVQRFNSLPPKVCLPK